MVVGISNLPFFLVNYMNVLKLFLLSDLAKIAYEYAYTCNLCMINKEKFIQKMKKLKYCKVSTRHETHWEEIKKDITITYNNNAVNIDYHYEGENCGQCHYDETEISYTSLTEFICCITHLYGFYKCIRDNTSYILDESNEAIAAHNKNILVKYSGREKLDQKLIKFFKFKTD